MSDRFLTFLQLARWTSAFVAVVYHLRFLLLVNYDAVPDKNVLLTGFYFLTGLGHESYAVFFVIDGILAGLILHRRRTRATAAGPGIGQHVGALYRVVLPGLLLGALFDVTGSRYLGHTGVYTAFPEFSTLTLTVSAFVGNALMLQPWIVPDFGGNSMLYLAAWLFWYFVLLAGFAHASALGKAGGRVLRVVLVAAVLAVMPYSFLIWSAIWLAGVGLVFLAEARNWRPPLVLGLAAFGATLLLSRLLGPHTAHIAQPMRDWLIQSGFMVSGLGFAVLAWALYPKREQRGPVHLASAAAAGAGGWSGQAAAFTFYFHFPVIMLLAAAGAGLWGLPLKQPPGPAVFAWFACLVGACVATAVIVTWAVARLLKAAGSGDGGRIAGAHIRHVQVDDVEDGAPQHVGEQRLVQRQGRDEDGDRDHEQRHLPEQLHLLFAGDEEDVAEGAGDEIEEAQRRQDARQLAGRPPVVAEKPAE